MAAALSTGMGQQNGTAISAGGTITEVVAWDFEPAQKLGSVVTNVTGGFEGQIPGSISGKGKVTILVPLAATSASLVFGADTVLHLYADKAKKHGFTWISASLESAPVSIDLSGDKGIQITYNFKANGPFNAIGAFGVMGTYNNQGTSSSGA